jgi:hypothetical protein
VKTKTNGVKATKIVTKEIEEEDVPGGRGGKYVSGTKGREEKTR